MSLVSYAARGDTAQIKGLLDQGFDVNAQQEDHYCNALHAAAEKGHLKTVELLLERGANINSQSRYYGNVLSGAARKGHLKTVELLLERGAAINVQDGSALCAAAEWGHLELVELLLERGADINLLGGHFGTALQTAIVIERLKIVNLLLERRADVNAQGGRYDNALYAAAIYGRQEMVNLLLEHGADVNIQGGYTGSALNAAATCGNQEIVNLLLEHGADVNIQGECSGGALHAAAADGYQEIANLLLKRGARVNAQGGSYGNALQAAAARGHLKIMGLLLDFGADVTIQPKIADRRSLLHVGVTSGNLAILEKLCGAGALVHLNTQDEIGLTPLHTAVDEGHVAMVGYLLEQGASPNVEDFGGSTPLQLAIRHQSRDIVPLLYSKTTVGLSSITAPDLRGCSGITSHCNLEMIRSESTQLAFRDESLFDKFYDMSYPLFSKRTSVRPHTKHFMEQGSNAKRMFILEDASKLHPEIGFGLLCRWWCESEWDWNVRRNSAPSQDIVRQTLQKCLLECVLLLTCYALPEEMKHWPNRTQLAEDFLLEHESRQGILWVMMKSNPQEPNSDIRNPVLQSRVFFSTSEYAEFPKFTTDLFVPLIRKVRKIWEHNFREFQKRQSHMRVRILRSNGADSSVIQLLLIDAQILDIFKDSLEKQIQTLLSFHDWYLSESSRAVHESSLDEVKNRMQEFKRESNELQSSTEKQLKNLAASSQSMIQLEFNLTSIAEAQKSTSTNRSLKRLSWITFIFLPLLFVASLFGMNIDILKNNPGWWWYLPFAMLTTLVTFAVWITFKWSNSLEGYLEMRFRRLIRGPLRLIRRPNRDQDPEDLLQGENGNLLNTL